MDDARKSASAGAGEFFEEAKTEEVVEKAPARAAVPAFMSKLIEANEKKYGKRGVVAGTKQLTVGIEPYSLALQWLMDLQVIPLQSIIVMAGEPKTYKTSALLELCKMAMLLAPTPGVGVVINTEGKWSPSKAKSMLGELSDLFQVLNAKSVEEWQEKATTALMLMKDVIQKKNDAKKRGAKSSEYKDMVIPPMVLGIDSVTGSQSEHVKENVQSDGFGKKTYQDRAMIIWQWLGTWSAELLGMPVMVVLAQHLKDKIDNQSTIPMKVTSGGSGGGFMCSMEIRVKNIKEIKTAKHEGALLQWRMNFNSYGRDKRKITIPFIETYDDNEEQMSYFDWDTALVSLIREMQEEAPSMRERLANVLGEFNEHTKTGVGAVYSCETLGIDKKQAMEENITSVEMGKRLQAYDGGLREQLRQALRVQPAAHWTPETEL